jgi:hypothetical protein
VIRGQKLRTDWREFLFFGPLKKTLEKVKKKLASP